MINKLIDHIENSLIKTNNYESKITDEILKMEGMSGRKTRHFYNNICSMENARYLEIGCWKGSSLCSAMCNNRMSCLGIDNWLTLGGPKQDFINNFIKFKGSNNASYIEKNCWEIDVSTIGKFNIYMYDGNHTETSHYQALNHYYSCLDDEFIYLVDDWNWEKVKTGTLNSIQDNKLKIEFKKEFFTDKDPGVQQSNNDWHNGLCIFVLSKI